METKNNLVQVLGIDAGATMTDTFIVQGDGRFVVGKAESDPADEFLAIYNSSVDALARSYLETRRRRRLSRTSDVRLFRRGHAQSHPDAQGVERKQ